MMRKLLWVWALMLIILLPSIGQAATYYISPSGDNGDAGGTGDPWKTFAFALASAQLDPGDTLVLKDGTYSTAAGTGVPDIDCDSGYDDGTSGNVITMTAENERQAKIQGTASEQTFYMDNCSYWTINGIHLANVDGDTPEPSGFPLLIENSDNLTLTRNIAAYSNSYNNTHCMKFVNVDNSLIEENEGYECHRHTFSFTSCDSNIIRRNYANGRDKADVGGGFPSDPTNNNDTAIAIYPGSYNIIENNISDNTGAGFVMESTALSIDNEWLGNMAVDGNYGFVFHARGDSLTLMPQDTIIENGVAINPTYYGAYFRNNKNTNCTNCTFIGAGIGGFAADRDGTYAGDGSPSAFAENVLSLSNTSYGFYFSQQADFGVDYSNAFGQSYPLWPTSSGNYANNLTENAEMGTCYLWIPDGSAMEGVGSGGADIGANILYQYEDGTITATKLWNATTGVFTGCGATVTGLNDQAGESCFDVHQRLNVNYNGCSFPAAYSGGPIVPELTIASGVMSFTGSGWGNDMWRVIVNKTEMNNLTEQYFGILDSLGKFNAAGSGTFNDLDNSVIVIPSGQTRYIRICPATVGVGCIVKSDEEAYTAP